ncbi:YheC/YheD family protein [Virgibacillus oceani]
MQIGYMNKNTSKTTKLLAKACKYYDIDLIYFNENNVDLDKEIIYGKKLVNNKWETIEMKEIPPYIDIQPYFFKFKDLIKFLKKRSKLSINKRPGSKIKVFNKIKREGSFSHLLIPYEIYTGYEDVIRFIKQHKNIILKPIFGSKGKDVYKITREGRKFLVDYLDDKRKYNKRQFKSFLKNNIEEDRTVIQKYIISRTKKDEPFDCRVRLEKNGKGKWEVAIILVRIGSNNKIVSNVKRGGGVSKLPSFLKANFENRAGQIEENINKIAQEFPPKLEEILDQRLVSLGLDLGINQSGKPYLFEVETGPGFEFGSGEVVSLKVDHYNYIKNN